MSSRGEVLRMGQKDSFKITTVFLILLHVVRGEICAENQYRPFARPWCCASKCGPGTRIARPCDEDDEESTECEPCGEGLFNPGRDQDRCTPKDRCNRPNEEIQTNGTDRTDNVCQCKVGSYREWEVCRHGPVCEPGTGATRNGICETCPDGTFSNETSHTQPCMAWTICWKLGFVLKEKGTNISDAICISRLPLSTRTWEKYSTTTKTVTKPVAVWFGLGSVVVLALSVSVIIGGICACKRKYDRPGTGVGGKKKAFSGTYFNALPDQTAIEIEELSTEEETLPLKPSGGDDHEIDMPTTGPWTQPKMIPDDGFSTGDDSCSDTLSALSDMDVNDSADMPGNAPVTNTTVTGDKNIYVTAGDNAVININPDPK